MIIQKLLVLGVLKTYPEFNCANLVWNRFEIDFEISSVKIRNVVRNYSINQILVIIWDQHINKCFGSYHRYINSLLAIEYIKCNSISWIWFESITKVFQKYF